MSDEFTSLVDAFLAKPKSLAGVITSESWKLGSSREVRRLVLPLEVDGEVSGPFVQVLAFPDWHILRFKINLSMPPMFGAFVSIRRTCTPMLGARSATMCLREL